MAHKPFPPDRLLQVSTHASSLQLVVAKSRAVGDVAQSADVLFQLRRIELFSDRSKCRNKANDLFIFLYFLRFYQTLGAPPPEVAVCDLVVTRDRAEGCCDSDSLFGLM